LTLSSCAAGSGQDAAKVGSREVQWGKVFNDDSLKIHAEIRAFSSNLGTT